jgi:hypothetical protein
MRPLSCLCALLIADGHECDALYFLCPPAIFFPFPMSSVSCRRKVGDYFFPELLVDYIGDTFITAGVM